MDDLQEYCKQWSGQRCWHCLDLFSRSRNFERQFEKNGFTATSYDVLNNPLQDITTRAGFLVLLNLGLQLMDDALMACAPPCSLFVGISSSVHMRSEFRLLGDTSRRCVRLSNLILSNFVVFLMLMKTFRPRLFVMVEQPASSWLFKQANFKEIIRTCNLRKTLTNMGLFG
ncbi:unnamed protein product, partial [Durusdinium trenchii]